MRIRCEKKWTRGENNWLKGENWLESVEKTVVFGVIIIKLKEKKNNWIRGDFSKVKHEERHFANVRLQKFQTNNELINYLQNNWEFHRIQCWARYSWWSTCCQSDVWSNHSGSPTISKQTTCSCMLPLQSHSMSISIT